MITIESALSRDNVPVSSESVANYMLVKLLPTAGEGISSLPLNLAVVIDNSGSMYDSDQRIIHAIEAACHVVDMLGPQDVVSVVAFHDHARTLQQSISAQNKEEIKEAIRSITGWESGGTRMATGMEKPSVSAISRMALSGNFPVPYCVASLDSILKDIGRVMREQRL